jgi:hypothetical protein
VFGSGARACRCESFVQVPRRETEKIQHLLERAIVPWPQNGTSASGEK